jgi:hypothetical protein
MKPKCEPGTGGVSLRELTKEWWASPDAEDDFQLKAVLKASLRCRCRRPLNGQGCSGSAPRLSARNACSSRLRSADGRRPRASERADGSRFHRQHEASREREGRREQDAIRYQGSIIILDDEDDNNDREGCNRASLGEVIRRAPDDDDYTTFYRQLDM